MTMTDPTPDDAVLPDARELIDRLTHNVETQRVLVDQTATGSVEREAARLAYAVMKDARSALLTPPAPDAAVPAGFVLVPVEPTEAMIVAGIIERHDAPCPEAWRLATASIYRSMLAAAPKVAICGAAASNDGTVQKSQTGRNSVASVARVAVDMVPDAAGLGKSDATDGATGGNPSDSPTSCATTPGPDLLEQAARVKEAAELLTLFVAYDDEAAPNGLMDAVDNSGHPYQSASMAGLVTHAKGWLEPNALAARLARYRAERAAVGLPASSTSVLAQTDDGGEK